MNKNTAKKQILKLYFTDGAGALMFASASWVALLAARGFSTIEIGLLESIFHLTSMTCEVPSGVVADVFGRKKTMIASTVMSVITSFMMIFANSFEMLAVTMMFCALSYNLASGTREALAYDSLKEAGAEDEYDKFASNDMIIYSIAHSAATMLAGAALLLGYKRAYFIDAFIGIIAVIMALSLTEVKTELNQKSDVKERFREVIIESLHFIKENQKARLMIIFNAAIGAVSILILFFLQAKLPEMGLNKALLGPALFVMGLGSVVGAKVIELFKNVRYRKIAMLSLLGIVVALVTVFSGNCLFVIIGGFIGAVADNFLEIRTDVALNNMIPSDQRATLMSINSFTFSVVMIVMSPVFGWIFA